MNSFLSARRLIPWLCLGVLLSLPGCGGCGKTPDAEEQAKQEAEKAKREKEKKKEKDPFEAKQPETQPTGPLWSSGIKPGHWFSYCLPEVKSNLGDFQGEMVTEITGSGNRTVPLVAVPYEMTTQRAVALAKEQPKVLESIAWAPPVADASSTTCKLAGGHHGGTVIERGMVFHRMRSHQYFFVVFAKEPNSYKYLGKDLDSIHLKKSTAPDDVQFQVVPMRARGRPNLPSHSLCWTSIAYILWDEADPNLLEIEQRKALLDWLHWGGQIIISGPNTLELLRNSYLSPYLPAAVVKSRKLYATDLQELQYWAGPQGKAITPVDSWAGVDWTKDPQAAFVPFTNDLVVERPVGRGRVVATAFRLTGPELTSNWPGFDDFFNACLLRRPHRQFYSDSELIRFRWANSNPNDQGVSMFDAARNTSLRYFTRDAGVDFKQYGGDVEATQGTGDDPFGNMASGDDSGENPSGSAAMHYSAGLAAWNDFSPAAQAARTTLSDATGITVPDRSFIVWVVLGYLTVLVPANWMVFRMIGRVEWAWVAAPLIAIACTVVVIKQAQLNIGFARSQNEVAVVEMQANYSRAHLTRYTAFYTSLATQYDLKLDDPGGELMPFPRVDSPDKFKMPVWQTRRPLVCRRGDDTQLTGMSISSNYVECVHSEEMFDFGGTLALSKDSNGVRRLINRTAHALKLCKVLRFDAKRGLEVASVEQIGPSDGAPLLFKPLPRSKKSPDAPDVPAAVPSGELNLTRMIALAMSRQEMRHGEVCLIAELDGVPVLQATPAAPQSRQAALLVAHLDPGSWAVPVRDSKLRSEVEGPRGELPDEEPHDHSPVFKKNPEQPGAGPIKLDGLEDAKPDFTQ